MVMPEVSAEEAVMDPVAGPEEEPKDSRVIPESSLGMTSSFFLSFFFLVPSFANILLVFLLADLPQDSDDFAPSMDETLDVASDELMEAESILPVVEEGTL